MLEETISKIESKLQTTGAIKDENRSELLELVSTLRNEVAAFSKTHDEQA